MNVHFTTVFYTGQEEHKNANHEPLVSSTKISKSDTICGVDFASVKSIFFHQWLR